MKQKVIKFLQDNTIVFVWLGCAIFMELVAQPFADASLHIVKFWMPMLLLGIIVSFLFAMKPMLGKRIAIIILLVTQIVIITIASFLYISNGSAFQKEMLSQRNDAFGTMEEFGGSIWLLLICLTVLAGFITYNIIDVKRKRKVKYKTSTHKWTIIVSSICAVVFTASFMVSPIASAAWERKQTDYYYMLTYRTGDGNQMYGSTTNILSELVSSAGANVNLKNLDGLNDFLYDELLTTSADYNGISSDNNLIMILAESLDTHILEEQYSGYTVAQTAQLFPNLTYLMKNGLYANNFYNKEKTDTAEILSLLGHYPTKKNVHYDFWDNEFPASLPNLFRNNAEALTGSNDDVVVNSFHQNRGSFYNRTRTHENMGFDNFYDVEYMKNLGVVDTWGKYGIVTKGERTLDSQTVDKCRDLMFPQGKTFFTHWISFAMHGYYKDRNNLARHYQNLDDLEMFPRGNKNENNLRTYAAATLDFDEALGIMLDELRTRDDTRPGYSGKKLIENTTIVIYSDHNTYYNNLTAYAKGLSNKNDVENFRIPFIIYDEELTAEYKNNNSGSNIISKFTTHSDIVPTILDLFGIPAWKNLYFGNSVFSDEESIVYSRVYGMFFNDKLLFYNMNNLLYTSNDFSREQHFTPFIEKAKNHLDKLYWIDKIYHGNLFAKEQYKYQEAV